MSTNRRQVLQFLAASGSVQWGSASEAQAAYPSQPVKLIVPFTAGSTTDVVARAVGERLERFLKQPVIVDNRPGAGGTVGAGAVAAAAADGYTVLVHSSGHVANAALYPKLRYDTLQDFTPVAMLATMPNVLVVSPARGYTSLKDLVDKSKAQPGKVLYSSAGNGSGSHIAAEKIRLASGMDASHVPYRGAPEALNDVMAGRVDWFMSPLMLALPLINGSKLAPLAVGAPKRSSKLPSVPTSIESGYPDSDYSFWVGMFVHSKTPPELVARLRTETERAIKSDEVQSRLTNLGAEAAAMPQGQFASLVRQEAADVASSYQEDRHPCRVGRASRGCRSDSYHPGDPSMFELYNAPQSTCSQKVRYTMAEKGIQFTEHRLKLFKNDQLKPEYLKLNPNGVVPTLVHDGKPIIDSSVIMEYLDELLPETSLTPSDLEQRAAMRAWMRFFEEVPTVAVRFPSYNAAFARHFEEMSDDEFKTLAASKPLRDKFLGEMQKEKGFSVQRLKDAEQSVRKTVLRMDTSLSKNEYLLGDKLTLADSCVLPPLIRMEDLGYERLWSDLPGVVVWLARMKARPSYKVAFYEGALLSQQYPGIRDEHQDKLRAAMEAAAQVEAASQ